MQPEDLATSTTSGTPVSNSTLVYDLDIFILVVILVFSLFNVPRALVYIANNRSEVFQGYLLRSSNRFRMYLSPSGTALDSKEKEPVEYTIPTLESPPVVKRWHFPMHLSLRHPAASVMEFRVLGNYTVIQVVLMAGYTGAVFYAAFYQSNPFTDPQRAGWVIGSQFPFVYAFATKNNVIGLLVGVGYEKVRV
jgi:ferric-chelate reductase